MKRLYLRADADSRIGTGHLMRCLALAQAWRRRGGCATFLSCADSPLRDRVEAEGFTVVPLARPHPDASDLAGTLEAMRAGGQPGGSATSGRSWLVLDGYAFDGSFQQAILDAGHDLLVIDDTAHLPSYRATLLLNQTTGAQRLCYATLSPAARLLGPEYALLREEFLSWRSWERAIPPVVSRVLVTLGGSDPGGTTLRVIEAIATAGVPGARVIVVAGGANPNGEAIENEFRRRGLDGAVVYNAGDMASLMADADLAISAAGSTCWELAFMRLPSILLVVADNQEGIARGMAEAGAAENLGDAAAVGVVELSQVIATVANSEARRRTMSEAGGRLVDGLGADRVAAAIAHYPNVN